jgi:large subunit ribosomal protein L35
MFMPGRAAPRADARGDMPYPACLAAGAGLGQDFGWTRRENLPYNQRLSWISQRNGGARGSQVAFRLVSRDVAGRQYTGNKQAPRPGMPGPDTCRHVIKHCFLGNIMPKMKTKKSAAKRFQVRGSGSIKRGQAFKRHILTKKTTKNKRHLRGSAAVHDTDLASVRAMLLVS